MATDGVKIIDGDLAHDIYNEFMELYDAGDDVESIKEKLGNRDAEFDEFELEVYVTTYALALWEIGALADDIFQKAKEIVSREIGVRIWLEEAGEKESLRRKKVLHEFINKISKPNSKPRKRKKYRTVQNHIFGVGEVLAFALPDRGYRVTLVGGMLNQKGKCYYQFNMLTYKSMLKPSLSDALKAEIVGRKIPNGLGAFTLEIIKLGFDEINKRGGFDEIIKKEAERTGSYVIGFSTTSIEHRDLLTMQTHFEKIGQLNLGREFQNPGSMSSVDTFERFTLPFEDIDNHLKTFKEEKLPLKRFATLS